MDLQMYYQKIREMETKIADEFPLVVSVETSDGGKSGTKTEVPRRLAAKLLVEGLARLATKDEMKAYRGRAGGGQAGGGAGGGGGEAPVDGAIHARSWTGCGATARSSKE